MSKELHCAVIGCGLMGARHAETIQLTEGYKCVCVCDAVKESASALGKKLGVEAVFDYAEVLKRKDVNGVVICLPSSMHADYGIRAAEAGMSVICEKPIDISIEKGQALIAACEKNKVLLTIISQNRFYEGAIALKKALDEKLLGDPLLVNVSIKWHRDDAYYAKSDWRGRLSGEGGGVLMNQGIHYTDLLLWYFGGPKAVKSLTRTSRDIIETEDVAAVLLKTESGAIATISASTSAYPGFPERMEIHGTLGSCVLEQGQIVYWKHKNDAPKPDATFDAPHPADLNSKLVQFQRQYLDILDAYRTGREPLVKPQEALEVVRTILWAYREKM